MSVVPLTKTGINALVAPATGQLFYQDAKQSGLVVRVTQNGSRSFVFDKNTARGRIRFTLGPAGTDALTVFQAREKASIAVGLVAEGYTREQIEARLARAEDRIPSDAATLGDVLDAYLAERAHKLGDRTRADYQKLIDTHLGDWKRLPIEVIDDASVAKKFASIKSPSRANYCFRVLRALFRYARSMRDPEGKPIVNGNPVEVLSQRRLWHANKAKRDVIGLAELPAWWGAVKELRSDANNGNADTVRDWLAFLILTGLRRGEASSLRWENVDLRGKMFTIPTTKNHDPHSLPLSDFLLDMLTRRHAGRALEGPRREYVFSGETGPLVEPKKQIAKVVAVSGVPFSAHTLRRTFATIAESVDIPFFALKRLMNHKSQDVTSTHYVIFTIERLREPMQKITDFILKAAGERTSAEVIEVQRVAP